MILIEIYPCQCIEYIFLTWMHQGPWASWRLHCKHPLMPCLTEQLLLLLWIFLLQCTVVPLALIPLLYRGPVSWEILEQASFMRPLYSWPVSWESIHDSARPWFVWSAKIILLALGLGILDVRNSLKLCNVLTFNWGHCCRKYIYTNLVQSFLFQLMWTLDSTSLENHIKSIDPPPESGGSNVGFRIRLRLFWHETQTAPMNGTNMCMAASWRNRCRWPFASCRHSKLYNIFRLRSRMVWKLQIISQ